VLALTTLPENCGMLDPVSKFIEARQAWAPVTWHVFILGNIVGSDHVFPGVATSSGTVDERNEQWIVNGHIGLVSQNDVFKY
jgi:hypothetical protein